MPADAVGQKQADGRSQPGNRAIAEIGHRGGRSALLGRNRVRPVSVDGDVLRCRQEHDQRRNGDDGRISELRILGGQERQGARHQNLCQEDPAATSSEQRNRESVHQRRPENLQQIRQCDVRAESDESVARARVFQPRLQRALGQLVWVAR